MGITLARRFLVVSRYSSLPPWFSVVRTVRVRRGGGYRVLYGAGYEIDHMRIDHMREALFARVPTADEVQLLQLPVGEAVVEPHRTTYTADGTVVEFAVGIHSASRFAWEYDFKVPDSAQDTEKQK